MLNGLRSSSRILDEDTRGFQTVKDTKAKTKRYVFVNKELFESISPKSLAEYLEKQLKLGNISDSKYKISDFISHLNNKKDIGSHFPVAKKGNDACISFGNTLLIFQDVKPDEVRKFIKDDTEYTHTFSINTFQWHTYNYIESLKEEDKKTFFGAAIKSQQVQMSGRLYIRNDDYYHEKYQKEVDFTRTEDNQNPHFNMGAVGLKFYLTKEQAEVAKIKLMHDYIDSKQNYLKYHFLGLWGGRNCSDYSRDFFNFIGFEEDFADYYIFDELDDRDQGIFYIMFKNALSHSYAQAFWYIACNPSDLADFVFNSTTGESFGKWFHDNSMWLSSISSSLYNVFNKYGDKQIHLFARNNAVTLLENEEYDCDDLNCQNDFGQTPLHIAIFYEQYNFANKLIDMGADVNVRDFRGHTPLYYAAKLNASREKQEFLERLVDLSDNIDEVDGTGEETALTAAVKANDPDAVSLLIEKGANPSFVNTVGDNLLNIALSGNSKSEKVVNVLYSKDANLIYHYNGKDQMPIVEIKKLPNASEVLPDIDRLYDPALVLTNSQTFHEDIDINFI